MPAIAAAPLFWGTLAAGAATAGAQVYGAHKQSSSADTAAKLQTKSAADALAFAQQQDARDRQSYADEYARKTALEDARLQRLRPYADAGAQASNTLSALLTQAKPIPVGRATGRTLSGLL
jgi:hypothetical protein